MWAVLGVLDVTAYNALTASMAGWLMWTYVLIGSIVLVNLLVAMFADTYNRVKEASEQEYTYMRYKRIFEYRHILLTLPPPFSTPIALFEIGKHYLALLGFSHCRLVRAGPAGYQLSHEKQARVRHTLAVIIHTTGTSSPMLG